MHHIEMRCFNVSAFAPFLWLHGRGCHFALLTDVLPLCRQFVYPVMPPQDIVEAGLFSPLELEHDGGMPILSRVELEGR